MIQQSKKNILILTMDAGFGHRSAANAVEAALRHRYGDRCNITLLNPADDRRAPLLIREAQVDYDRIIQRAPELYTIGYNVTDGNMRSALLESSLILLLYELMDDVVRRYEPDAILTTFPIYQSALEAVFLMRGMDIPLVTVITDLVTLHKVWFHPNVTQCLVPTPEARALAAEAGIPSERVRITGIPVNPDAVLDQRPQAEIRQALGWRPDIPTLLAVGSKRVDRLKDTLAIVNHFGMPMQLAVVTGRDREMYDMLEREDWHIPVHLYEFVNNVPEMMRAADAVICKAGGLIVTESLANKRPMILIDVIQGQETGNMEFVLRNGVGDLATTDIKVLETLAHWTANDGKLWKERSERAATLGKPNAAFDVADAVFDLAQRGPQPLRGGNRRRRLLSMLRRNKIHYLPELEVDE